LRGHVEPKSREEYDVGALMDYIWILKEVQVTCVFTLGINFGESSVVVIPRKLKWPSSKVLDIILRWKFCSEYSIGLLIVTTLSSSACLWFSADPFSNVD
jgi:hypothetical protein